MTIPFQDDAVAQTFAAFPDDVRASLLALRALIFKVGAETPGVGAISETLKWGQPAYLTPKTKAGSTLRLGQPKSGGFAIYTHCQTRLISDFRTIFPTEFSYDGNRAIQFAPDASVPTDKLALFMKSALTYHMT